MVKLDGCEVPDTKECEICRKEKPTLDVEWHKVHDHPAYLACPECRAKMDKWKPLGIWLKPEDEDHIRERGGLVPIRAGRVKKKRRRPPKGMGVPAADIEPDPGAQEEPGLPAFDLDASITLDDL